MQRQHQVHLWENSIDSEKADEQDQIRSNVNEYQQQ